MKKLFLAGCAALFLATGAAHAEIGKWEFNGHRCAIETTVNEATIEKGGLVQILPENIPVIEAGLIKLKACDRFYNCIVKRDWRRYTPDAKPKEPIPKRCPLPKELRGTTAE
jgi:hypothetical protein